MKNSSITGMVKSMALMFVLALMVTSCKSKVEKLMDALPADADVVVVGDVKSVVESVGGTVKGSEIKLTNDVMDMELFKNADLEKGIDKVKESGVNAEACAALMDFKENKEILVLVIEDEKKFVKYIESEDYEKDTEEDGVTYYEKKNEYSSAHVAMKGSMAYVINRNYDDDFKAEKFFSKLIESADEASFGGTGMGKYIKEGNVGGVSVKLSKEIRNELENEGVPSDIADMVKGYVCFRGMMKDNTANVSMKLFNNDGEEMTADDFKGKFDLKGTINAEALKFMDKDEFMVYAVNMKDVNLDDYQEILFGKERRFSPEEQTVLIAAKAYLEKIDGTVAVGVGLTNGIESFKTLDRGRDIDKELAATMVFESKKAESMVNDLKTILDTYTFPYETIADGIKITIPGETMEEPLTSWSIVSKDGFLVISNREVKKNESDMFAGIDLDKTNAMVVLNLPASNQLMKDVSVKSDLKMVLAVNSENMEATLNCEFGEGTFLTGILEASEGLMKAEEKYRNERAESSEYAYDDEYYCDTTVVTDPYAEEAYEEVY